MPEPIDDVKTECVHAENGYQDKSNRAARFPEEHLSLLSVRNTLQIHTEVGCEEREGEENDSHDRKEKNGFVLTVSDDGKLVLFNRAELKELEQ